MNLSAINVTHSIDSLSLPSSPELLNTNTLITTTNNHIINSNLSSAIEVNTKLNGNELKSTSNLYHSHPQQHQHHHHRHHNHHHHQQQQHHYHSNYQQPNHEMTLSSTPSTTSPSSSSASPSSSVPSMSTSNGILSMNQLTNSLYFPFTSNIILQESINLIYSTCLNIFDKRLNDELNKFNQKYEFLLNECNESRIRLNKLENIIQLYEEKYHKMNIPSPLLPSSSLPSSSSLSSSSSTSPSSLSSSSYYYLYNSLKSQQFNESIDNHIMNTLKNIDHKWLINWKNYEDYSNNKQNHFLAPKTTSGLDEHQQRQQQQQEQQSLQKMNKMKENPIEYDINHLSNTSINDNVNHQSNFFNESNLSRLYNNNNNNNFCNFDNLLPSSLTLNNQHLLWNQWMANFITTNHCINSINGLLSSSSTPLPSSPSSLPSHSILNNLEKINNFTTSNMESMEGNQHKSSRLYSPMFLSSSEYNPNDLLNSNRKSSSLSSSTSPTTMPTSSSSSLRFRGNKFGRLKTKSLNLNRYPQNYSLSNNRLHLCNKPSHFNSIMATSALKTIRRSTINLPNSHWSNLSLGSQITTSSASSPTYSSIIDQKFKSNFLTDLQFPESNINDTNGLLSSSVSNLRGNHQHNNNNNTSNNLIDRPVVVLNPDEPREIFIGGVQSVALPLWAYCKCLTMVRGEPHELGPRLCLRLLQSLFSLHYLVTHNYNGSGGKAPIDPIVMSAVLRQAQLQFGSGYFFTEPMALGKLRDYLNNAFRVMAFRQRKGERVRSPFWNEKGEPIHDLEAPVEFSNITDIIVIPHSVNTITPTTTTTVITATTTLSTTTTMSNESDLNMNSR